MTARFHCLSLGQADQLPNPAFVRAAGNQWAKKAEALVLQDYGKPTAQKLMVRPHGDSPTASH